MRRTLSLTLAIFFVAGCSALVRIDDDKYLRDGGVTPGDGDGTGGDLGDGDDLGDGGMPGDGDGDVETGGSGGGGDGDGDEPSGGMGGEGASDSGGGGSGGGGSGGGSGGGTGGTPIEIPDPVHYYPLDEDTQDYGTGAALSATASNNVTWHPTTGVAGGSLEIPASNDGYLALDPAVGNTNPYTISWWFISSRDGFITLAHRIPAPQSIHSWEMILDTGRPRLKVGGVEYDFNPDFKFALSSDGVWTHVVLAYEDNASGTNDHFKVWVDATIVLERSLVLDTEAVVAGEGIVFGQSIGGTDPFFGYVDEIRVYDTFLDDADVQNLYLYDKPQAQ